MFVSPRKKLVSSVPGSLTPDPRLPILCLQAQELLAHGLGFSPVLAKRAGSQSVHTGSGPQVGTASPGSLHHFPIYTYSLAFPWILNIQG